MEFKAFSKIPRLVRGCVITEKIDGTNAQVYIVGPDDRVIGDAAQAVAEHVDGSLMFAGSRNRWITPTADNYNFARWVETHAVDLWALGPGQHFGEWWGNGIQRGYGLVNGDKRFSLFNTGRWVETPPPSCCGVVPVLYRGYFCTEQVAAVLDWLRADGSQATPFMDPEGIVVYHEASRQLFKQTLDNDGRPKSLVEVAQQQLARTMQ